MGIRTVVAAIAALVVQPTVVFAWGNEGHRVIAQIAADDLTPAAKRQVEQLLGGEEAIVAMAAASTWADEIRGKRPATATWHYVDIPLGARSYNPGRDCLRDDCVVAQIIRDVAIIGNKQLLQPARAEALRFLIHFVADIHQPLHAADNHDRGGNGLRVVLGARKTNMHAVWDTDVVRALGRSSADVTARLEREITPLDKIGWQSGSAATWANESFQIAGAEIYNGAAEAPTTAAIVLPADYAKSESRIAKLQIEKAAVRLAWLLNGVLK